MHAVMGERLEAGRSVDLGDPSPETLVHLSREVAGLTLCFGFLGVEKCVELFLWVTERTHYNRRVCNALSRWIILGAGLIHWNQLESFASAWSSDWPVPVPYACAWRSRRLDPPKLRRG